MRVHCIACSIFNETFKARCFGQPLAVPILYVSFHDCVNCSLASPTESRENVIMAIGWSFKEAMQTGLRMVDIAFVARCDNFSRVCSPEYRSRRLQPDYFWSIFQDLYDWHYLHHPRFEILATFSRSTSNVGDILVNIFNMLKDSK